MKKIIFIALLLVSSASFGQFIKIGVRAGAGMSWTGIKDENQNDSYFTNGPSYGGFSAGLASEFKLSKRFAIKAEALYLRTAGSQAYVAPNASGVQETSYYDPFILTQIQFPALLRLNVRKIYFLAGPSYSKLLPHSSHPISIPNSSIWAEYDSHDFGLNTGIGVDITKKPQISLELRHYRGFRKLDSVGYHQSFAQAGLSVLF